MVDMILINSAKLNAVCYILFLSLIVIFLVGLLLI